MIMGPVFMSAGIPLSGTGKLSDVSPIAIREAVRGLLRAVLPDRVLVSVGNPAIAPLVWAAAASLQCTDKIEFYLPKRFANPSPGVQGFWARTVLVEDSSPDFSEADLNFRTKMISSRRFVAGIFIGGGAGVLSDWEIFRALLPDVPAYPVALTSAAARCLLEQESNSLPEQIRRMLSEGRADEFKFREIFDTAEPPSTQ
jgi:hypothetical protein